MESTATVRLSVFFLLLTVLSSVVNCTYFIQTHKQGRFVKASQYQGKRSGGGGGDVATEETEQAEPEVTREQEKEACKLILKMVDGNIDHLLHSKGANGEAPMQAAIRHLAQNLSLVQRCLTILS